MFTCPKCGDQLILGAAACLRCRTTFPPPGAPAPSFQAPRPSYVPQPAYGVPPAPFAPPPQVYAPPPPYGSPPAYGFGRPPTRSGPLGWVAAGLLIAIALIGIGLFVGTISQWDTYDRYMETPLDSFAEDDAIVDALAADDTYWAFVGLTFLALLAAGPVTGVWLFRVRSTLRPAVIGGWTTALAGLWALCLSAGVVTFVGAAALDDEVTLRSYAYHPVSLLADSLWMAAAVMGTLLVILISRRHDRVVASARPTAFFSTWAPPGSSLPSSARVSR